MQLQYNHLVIPLSLSIILIIGLILLGLRLRKNPVAIQFLFFMVCLLIWMVMSLVEVVVLDLHLSLLAADLSFLGTTFFPLAWLGIVMTYLGSGVQFRRIFPYMSVIPILTNLIIWTNPLHFLWRSDSFRDLTTTWFPISIYNYGAWFSVVHMPFSLGIAFIAIFLLVRSFFVRERVYRIQIVIMLIALIVPLSVEMLHQLGFQPIPHYNSSTLIFPFSALLVGWALLRFQLFDLTPIARELVVESMQDMMIVLDNHDRIVDVNPAARRNLFQGDMSIIGENIDALPYKQSQLISQLISSDESHHEIKIEHGDNHKIYEVYLSPISPHLGDDFGILIVLHDITHRKIAQQALYEQVQQVAILEERQRLARELHDSVNQTLFAAQMLSDLLPRAIEKKPEKVPEYAANIRQLIHGTTAELRLVLMELYPDALIQTDLGTIIKHLCDAYTGSTGTPVQFVTASQIYLKKDAHIAFYRIAQEALHNVSKHTDATQVTVKLIQGSHQIELNIQDNGLGFDVDNTPSDHFGLKNMRTRATDVGAVFDIVSEVNQGTTISVIGNT